MAHNRVPELMLAYLVRIGVKVDVSDDRLLLGSTAALTESDRNMIRDIKSDLIELIRSGNACDNFRWPPRLDGPEHRARALPREFVVRPMSGAAKITHGEIDMFDAREIRTEATQLARTSQDEQIRKLATRIQQLASRLEDAERRFYRSPQRVERELGG